eukprot:CAMPEP_0180287194 /NCGR_PEP_ID=MMETSP0988-20121125/13172_1 /TAXON_ID=697907 /ORGANISM="non described non described, Strain CCMP2293" /LENGTH=100 /DNA_ID=CAMNT_0022261363 /DNA_START=290 /DNA_END=592 /DNA_ORIENTATION=-
MIELGGSHHHGLGSDHIMRAHPWSPFPPRRARPWSPFPPRRARPGPGPHIMMELIWNDVLRARSRADVSAERETVGRARLVGAADGVYCWGTWTCSAAAG